VNPLQQQTTPPAYSGADLPADRPAARRRYGAESVPVLPGRREKPAPQPTAVELLADLVDKLAASEKAAAERHAEILARLDALDARVRRAEDSADCASAAVEESEGRIRVWLHQVFNTVEDIADELLGDAPEDTGPLLTPVD